MSTVFQNCELETSCPAIKESSWLNREKELRVFPQKKRTTYGRFHGQEHQSDRKL